MGIFARISGYRKLAAIYPASGPAQGLALSRQTVQIGPVRFRRCVTVHICETGLRLQPRVVFQEYVPVEIPWDEISGALPSKVYGQPATLFTIGDPRVGTISVKTDLSRKIEPKLPDLMASHV